MFYEIARMCSPIHNLLRPSDGKRSIAHTFLGTLFALIAFTLLVIGTMRWMKHRDNVQRWESMSDTERFLHPELQP